MARGFTDDLSGVSFTETPNKYATAPPQISGTEGVVIPSSALEKPVFRDFVPTPHAPPADTTGAAIQEHDAKVRTIDAEMYGDMFDLGLGFANAMFDQSLSDNLDDAENQFVEDVEDAMGALNGQVGSIQSALDQNKIGIDEYRIRIKAIMDAAIARRPGKAAEIKAFVSSKTGFDPAGAAAKAAVNKAEALQKSLRAQQTATVAAATKWLYAHDIVPADVNGRPWTGAEIIVKAQQAGEIERRLRELEKNSEFLKTLGELGEQEWNGVIRPTIVKGLRNRTRQATKSLLVQAIQAAEGAGIKLQKGWLTVGPDGEASTTMPLNSMEDVQRFTQQFANGNPALIEHVRGYLTQARPQVRNDLLEYYGLQRTNLQREQHLPYPVGGKKTSVIGLKADMEQERTDVDEILMPLDALIGIWDTDKSKAYMANKFKLVQATDMYESLSVLPPQQRVLVSLILSDAVGNNQSLSLKMMESGVIENWTRAISINAAGHGTAKDVPPGIYEIVTKVDPGSQTLYVPADQFNALSQAVGSALKTWKEMSVDPNADPQSLDLIRQNVAGPVTAAMASMLHLRDETFPNGKKKMLPQHIEPIIRVLATNSMGEFATDRRAIRDPKTDGFVTMSDEFVKMYMFDHLTKGIGHEIDAALEVTQLDAAVFTAEEFRLRDLAIAELREDGSIMYRWRDDLDAEQHRISRTASAVDALNNFNARFGPRTKMAARAVGNLTNSTPVAVWLALTNNEKTTAAVLQQLFGGPLVDPFTGK